MKKVTAISGSHRLSGNTEDALQAALDIMEREGIETKLVALVRKKREDKVSARRADADSVLSMI